MPSHTRGPHCALGDRCAEGARSRCRGGVGRSSRQALAALETTGLQDGATAAGGHARPETVLHRPALLVGLIRTLHTNSSGLDAPHRQNARSRRNFGHQLVSPANGPTRQATGVIGHRATHRTRTRPVPTPLLAPRRTPAGRDCPVTPRTPCSMARKSALEIHYPQPATVISPVALPPYRGSGTGHEQQVRGQIVPRVLSTHCGRACG